MKRLRFSSILPVPDPFTTARPSAQSPEPPLRQIPCGRESSITTGPDSSHEGSPGARAKARMTPQIG